MAVVRCGPRSRFTCLLSRLPSIRLEREPHTLAMASSCFNRVVVSDVQLQPLWWSPLRGVWLEGISAGSFARDVATLVGSNLCRFHVGVVACTAFPSKLEQFFTGDIHRNLGWVINTDGIRVQFIRLRCTCSDPYALGV